MNPSRRQVIANEQLVDNELNLFGVQVDMAAPPALKSQIAGCLGVDLRIDIVLFGPERIRRVLIFEILYEPGAIEFSVAEIADKGGEPTATEESAGIAHRIFAAHAAPIRER